MHKVTFRPDLRAVDARSGERLLHAAWKCGVGIKSVCGGRGKCGSCLVEVESDSPDALSPITEPECELLPAEVAGGVEETADAASGDLSSGIGEAAVARGPRRYRLACLAEVSGDVVVSVPPESQAIRSAPRKPYTATPMEVEPAVRDVVVELEPARMEEPQSFAQRIVHAVGRASDVARHASDAAGHASGVIARAEAGSRIDLGVDVVADFALRAGFDSAQEVTATLHGTRRVIRVRPGRTGAAHGLAIDVGTTSLVLFLCRLGTGEIVAVRTAGNPQAIYGEDVISRMSHIQRELSALSEMQRLLVEELNRMLADALVETGVDADDVLDAVVVGNPTMQHILLGVNPEPLGRGPYLPVWSDGVDVEAKALGLAITPRARVFVFPSISGYIGGDTIAALLTRSADFERGAHLLVDVGTNGEVVLAHDGELTATSCATGPVYEGAHIRCGVRASPGAIERVWVEPSGRVRWSAIPADHPGGDRRPVGLCGSGVISGIAALVGAGLVGTDGAFAPASRHPQLRSGDGQRAKEVVLVPGAYSRTGRDVVLTQTDVRAVQLGKSALRAGIEILLAERGVTRLDCIHLAGTFGNHLEPDDILRIGMVPPVEVSQIRSIGNAAGDGARMALFSRRERARAARIAQRIRVLELSGRVDFQDLFIQHTALAAEPEPLHAQ